MKAFHVFCGSPRDGSLLIFAETANKARAKAVRDGPYDWEYEYLDTRAWRCKDWDRYAGSDEKFIETNSDLPAGALPFYHEEDFGR